jgi:hypothetical protein
MSFLRDAAFTAVGYGLNSFVHRGERKRCQSNGYDSLEDIILDYAHRHDIWGRDENFYQKLIKIADQFHDPYAY